MGFFKSLFSIDDKSPEQRFDVLKYDGLRAMQTRQMQHALQCFQAALQIHDDLEIHDYLSQLYVHLDQMPAAIGELGILAQAQPDNEQIYLRMAHVAYMMEDYDLQLDACRKAEALSPDDEEMRFLMARAFIGKGQPDVAVEYLNRIAENEGEHYNAWLLRGETLLQMGDVEGAARDADRLLADLPQLEEALLLKARVERQLGHLEEARLQLNQVIDLNPFSVMAFRERAVVHFALGMTAEAEEDTKTLLELSPNEENRVGEGEKGVEDMVKEQLQQLNPLGL